MRVRIRKEKDYFLAYFIDSRRIIGVNEVGAIILDLLLNKEKKAEEIVTIIASNYEVSIEAAKADFLKFIEEIKQEILPGRFTIVEQEQLIAPLGVELEITTACNLRCKHCFQKSYDNNFMETSKVIEIIRKLADNNVFEIGLIGGEPFKHPGLMEILQCCKEQEMAVNIVTNGTLLEETIIDQLAKIPRLTLAISLDGTREIHDLIRGDNVFDKVNDVLRIIVLKGMPVEVICTLNAINIGEYKEIVEHCESLDIPCNFNLFKPFKKDQEYLIPEPSVFFETIIDLLKIRHSKKKMIGLSNAAIVTELLGLPPRNECRATLSGLVIDINGKMVTCPLLAAAGFYADREFPTFDDDFLRTWRENKLFTDFRENGLRECQARSYVFSGDVKGYDAYGINAFQNYLKTNNIKITEGELIN